ncbi:MAG TPA: fluoride efflux transporter CrcB [Burkholderiaceae bacterium]
MHGSSSRLECRGHPGPRRARARGQRTLPPRASDARCRQERSARIGGCREAPFPSHGAEHSASPVEHGAALRHFVNGASLRLVGSDWPLGTLFINVTGSILMGVVAALFAFKLSLPPTLRLFIATGILGGYTTFSTFSLETALLMERGQSGFALLYVAGSVLLGVGGLFTGMWAVRALT